MPQNSRLVVSKNTHDLITKNCVQVFLDHHPKFRGMRLTHEFIIKRVAEYYLEGEDEE